MACKSNISISKIRQLSARTKNYRPIGLAKKAFNILPSFYEALPKDLMQAFYLKNQAEAKKY